MPKKLEVLLINNQDSVNVFRLFPKAALKPGAKFAGLMH